ncbi:MAG: hypothetical protein OZ948_03450 [Deltaproteobacteria bacterium]|nr:hypothetical protein [Deltaproteobacteria bacterium]
MSEREPDPPLVARARAQLDHDVAALDETTRARLRAARLRALGTLERPATTRRAFVAPRGLVATAAGAAVLALVVASWRQREDTEGKLAVELDDVELLASADDLELYDDLDFYRWLAEDAAL